MSTRLANNVQGVLSGAIASGATAMNVTLDTGSNSYPVSIDGSNPMYLTLSDPTSPMLCEIVRVTAVSGSNVTTMTRGQRGTAAVGWAAGARVSLNAHAQDFPVINDAGDLTVAADVSAVNGTFTGIAQLAAGSAAAPSLHFGDLATGIYRSGEDEIAITTDGVQRLQINSDGLYGPRYYWTHRALDLPGSQDENKYFLLALKSSDDVRINGVIICGRSGSIVASEAQVEIIYGLAGTRTTPSGCIKYIAAGHASYTRYMRYSLVEVDYGGATYVALKMTKNGDFTTPHKYFEFFGHITGTVSLTQVRPSEISNEQAFGGYNGEMGINHMNVRFQLSAGFWGANPPSSKPTVTNLATLITALESYGLVTDGT